MATYKTPDVYVEEISLFPPSVAEVETAVPAFIGYTQMADKNGKDDLKNVPTKVTSLLEYEQYFGKGPALSFTSVTLDANNAFSSVVTKRFYMYDSLRIFFKNGGGKCYIISIGAYPTSIQKTDFDAGLTALKRQDEPTMILFPDAVDLSADNLASLQQAALLQCADLGDRVGIFDVKEIKTGNKVELDQSVQDFRDKVGINNLKYGTAYMPWIKTNLAVTIPYRTLKGNLKKGTADITLGELTDDPKVNELILNADNAIADALQIESDISTLAGTASSLQASYVNKINALRSATTDASKRTKFNDLFAAGYDIAVKVDDWAAGSNQVIGPKLLADINKEITDGLLPAITTLIGYDGGANAALTDGGIGTTSTVFSKTDYDNLNVTDLKNIFDTPPAADTSLFTGTTLQERVTSGEKKVSEEFYKILASIDKIKMAAQNYEMINESLMSSAFPTYKKLIEAIARELTTLPPSGAIAGVYAMVDNARGVWKAPANVSLNSVVGVTEVIDNKEQEDLNVDTVAGKSINAIRPFTGKGILVWGARTLAGNDNEWRYISVRRFFNMVEESVKKSTYWAVFEPNDANTWIKVKSMIENYLIQKWRDGALQGAVPDQAFFVNVGLGTTMTALDILEGRMIVEIGMAVVRPAEFIILRFSHKMVEPS